MSTYRCGEVAIVGRPNVGKSTLLNALVGTKVAITTPKPQTTRNRILGIRTLPDAQLIFLDTPGLHPARSPLNRRLVQTARETLAGADVVLVVVDVKAGLTPPDAALLHEVTKRPAGVVLALNKIDRIAKPALLPLLATIGSRWPEVAVVPVSALRGTQTDAVLSELVRLLPEGEARFDSDEYTTATVRFLAQELIREQVFLATEEEIPYGSAVVIERWEEEGDRDLVVVHATVLVERPGHKAIVIGKGAERLKAIGTAARLGIEELIGKRVYLELFVRAEPGWMRRPDRVAELDL